MERAFAAVCALHALCVTRGGVEARQPQRIYLLIKYNNSLYYFIFMSMPKPFRNILVVKKQAPYEHYLQVNDTAVGHATGVLFTSSILFKI